VDYHVTRTLARAQWEILGFGPYASLPRERRMEVRDVVGGVGGFTMLYLAY
jgi:hypothetical protein